MKKLLMSCVVVLSAVWLAVSAHAVTFDLPADDGILNSGDYDFAGLAFGRNTTINNTYTFEADVASVILDISASATSNFMVGNQLLYSFVDVTNGNSVISSGNLLLGSLLAPFNLVIGNQYAIIITGASRSVNGSGSYSVSVSAVPVPPALILLASGLVGAGLLGRRRQRTKKVAV
jgi:hypothetical protein